MQKKNYLRYKKIELIKGELLRLEARRAQLELCERSSELEKVEKKIILKRKNYLNVLIGKSIKFNIEGNDRMEFTFLIIVFCTVYYLLKHIQPDCSRHSAANCANYCRRSNWFN